MELADRIRVTVHRSGGIAMPNLDATRRLREIGITKRTKGRGVITCKHSRTQAEALAMYPAIRDLAHYRQLVGDERSDGPLVCFFPGAMLLMERTEHPKSKKTWYMVLDTAIGARPDFLQELATRRSVTITNEPIN